MNTPIAHYVMLGGQQQGPLSFSQLQTLWRAGEVNGETPHYMDGYSEWLPLGFISEDLEPPRVVPCASAFYQSQPRAVAKSRGIYVILGLFLGGLFGVHNFYIGRFVPGVAQLLITLITGVLIVPLLLVAVWVLCELVIVTKDGKGRPLA